MSEFSASRSAFIAFYY